LNIVKVLFRALPLGKSDNRSKSFLPIKPKGAGNLRLNTNPAMNAMVTAGHCGVFRPRSILNVSRSMIALTEPTIT